MTLSCGLFSFSSILGCLDDLLTGKLLPLLFLKCIRYELDIMFKIRNYDVLQSIGTLLRLADSFASR